MRPLPPYTMRPLKRREVHRTTAAANVRATTECLSMSVRTLRTSLKHGAVELGHSGALLSRVERG